MFGLGLATKIYIAVEAVDMRKGFEGLYGLNFARFVGFIKKDPIPPINLFSRKILALAPPIAQN